MKCETCDNGQIPHEGMTYVTCPDCNGTGKQQEQFASNINVGSKDGICEEFERYYGETTSRSWMNITFTDFYIAYENGYKTAINKSKQQIEDLKNISDDHVSYLKALSDAETQIESMKCCGNCSKFGDCLDNDNAFCRNVCDKWRIKTIGE